MFCIHAQLLDFKFAVKKNLHDDEDVINIVLNLDPLGDVDDIPIDGKRRGTNKITASSDHTKLSIVQHLRITEGFLNQALVPYIDDFHGPIELLKTWNR